MPLLELASDFALAFAESQGQHGQQGQQEQQAQHSGTGTPAATQQQPTRALVAAAAAAAAGGQRALMAVHVTALINTLSGRGFDKAREMQVLQTLEEDVDVGAAAFGWQWHHTAAATTAARQAAAWAPALR